MANADRPLFVAIVAILNIILGILIAIGGIAIGLDLGDFLRQIAEQIYEQMDPSGGIMVDDIITALKALGWIVCIAGLINFLIGFGMWQGWRIMWYLGVIFNAIELIFAVLSVFAGNFVGIIGAVVNGVILYYLFRPNVKEFFSI